MPHAAIWSQIYDPFGSAILSTLVAAIPIVVLLGLIVAGKVQAHIAAVLAGSSSATRPGSSHAPTCAPSR